MRKTFDIRINLSNSWSKTLLFGTLIVLMGACGTDHTGSFAYQYKISDIGVMGSSETLALQVGLAAQGVPAAVFYKTGKGSGADEHAAKNKAAEDADGQVRAEFETVAAKVDVNQLIMATDRSFKLNVVRINYEDGNPYSTGETVVASRTFSK